MIWIPDELITFLYTETMVSENTEVQLVLWFQGAYKDKIQNITFINAMYVFYTLNHVCCIPFS